MTPADIDRIVATVKASASEQPIIFLELLVRRALMENGTDAIPQFAQACRDMGDWYEVQADALEQEAKRRHLNVVPLGKRGDAL